MRIMLFSVPCNLQQKALWKRKLNVLLIIHYNWIGALYYFFSFVWFPHLLLCGRAKKLLSLRLFEDGNQRKWAKCICDLHLEILCVSQFTLNYTLKGNKPDFRHALNSKESKILYDKLIEKLQVLYDPTHIKGIYIKHFAKLYF